MRNQNVTYTVYGIPVPGEVFFCSGYRSLIGKVLRFFSLKFRSLGGFGAESIVGNFPTPFSDSKTKMMLRCTVEMAPDFFALVERDASAN